MNVEIRTETPIFLFWEYLFRNFGILSLQWSSKIFVWVEGILYLAKSKQLISGYSSISESFGPHAKSGLQQRAASRFSATGHFSLLEMLRGIDIAVRT